MSDLTTTPATSTRIAGLRIAARWMVTFLGFPAGGLVAELVGGPVNDLLAALIGGLITGLFVGAAQAVGLGRAGPPAWQWIGATAVGLTLGLGIGSAAVDYGTSLPALVIQGLICGFAVGGAQAFGLGSRLGWPALAWPPALAVIWALGWAVTTVFGVQVDQQFTVFGSSGAIVVTALTTVLPLVLNRSAGNPANAKERKS